MTELLERAIIEIGKLPAPEQDAIASRLLTELANENEWVTRFSATTHLKTSRSCIVASRKNLPDMISNKYPS